jgi:hypothetical protein
MRTRSAKDHKIATARAKHPDSALAQSLSQLEQDFAQAFLGPAKGDAYKAAHMAGCASSAYGLTIIARPNVRAYIDMQLEALSQAGAALTPIEIHRIWRNLAQNPDPNIVLRATENAAKTYGMFNTPTEQTITVRQQTGVEQLANLDTLFDQLPSDVLDVMIALLAKKKENKQLTAEVLAEVVSLAAEWTTDEG